MGYLETWGSEGRICTSCGEMKSWEEFGPRAKGRNGRQSACRTCVAVRRTAYRNANRERINARDRVRDRATGRHTQRRYGISRPAWDAQIKVQGGRCAIPACSRLPRRRLVGDHCHTTGKFRGIICDNCNVAMGLTGDDPNLLRALADWLERA